MRTGSDVLSWLSFKGSSVPQCLMGQARILAFYYWSTYCILKARRNVFMDIKPLMITSEQVELVMRQLPPPLPAQIVEGDRCPAEATGSL